MPNDSQDSKGKYLTTTVVTTVTTTVTTVIPLCDKATMSMTILTIL